MIYEVRTYDLKPHSVKTVFERFAAALESRLELSPLAAMWYTDIGPLNQIVHIWPYESTDQRAEIRAAAVEHGNWPPDIAEFIVRANSQIFQPFPFMKPLAPAELGPIYEMRTYKTESGLMRNVGETWEPALPARTALSPLVAMMYADIGNLDTFVHIWAYKSLDERARIRREAEETGVWPPKGGKYRLITMENKILLPAPFSPLQ